MESLLSIKASPYVTMYLFGDRAEYLLKDYATQSPLKNTYCLRFQEIICNIWHIMPRTYHKNRLAPSDVDIMLIIADEHFPDSLTRSRTFSKSATPIVIQLIKNEQVKAYCQEHDVFTVVLNSNQLKTFLEKLTRSVYNERKKKLTHMAIERIKNDRLY